MLVEATLDFPEEEIDFLEAANARGKLQQIQILNQAKQGALLRDGLNVVLIGQPNVGKSSLLNALAGAELEIVTPIAGTRDKISQTIQIEGIPLNIIDTAGLREATYEVEKIGIERSWQAVREADIVLDLFDAANIAQANNYASVSHIQNTPSALAEAQINHALKKELPAHTLIVTTNNQVAENNGIELLRKALLKVAGAENHQEGLYIGRKRHIDTLKLTQEHLYMAQSHAAQNAQALDLFAGELRLAQDALNSITVNLLPMIY
ncbi:hypothetical protein ACTFIZ_012868 [Dictyostelium cf. discoideum]